MVSAPRALGERSSLSPNVGLIASPSAGAPGSKTPRQRAWLVPIRITPDVGTTLAAGRANEPVLDIRQPNAIWLSITAHPDIVAATIVLTKDQEPAHAGGAHFGKGDFLRASDGGRAPSLRGVAIK